MQNLFGLLLHKDDIKLRGIHNYENICAALAATETLATENIQIEAIKNFKGVEHRLEFVRELDGVKYYNDSIASSPTRTLAGLRAFDEKVILIAGGYDKHIPFEPLANEGYPYIKHLILVGDTRDKIKMVFDKLEEEKGIKIDILMADTFEESIKTAKKIAQRGDIVTLSPACASFDLFPNFMARGNKFKEIVNSL